MDVCALAGGPKGDSLGAFAFRATGGAPCGTPRSTPRPGPSLRPEGRAIPASARCAHTPGTRPPDRAACFTGIQTSSAALAVVTG